MVKNLLNSNSATDPGSLLQKKMDEPWLLAYQVSSGSPMRVMPAPSAREWMEKTRDRFANRCLPLLIANQAGWFVLNSHALCVTWTGGDDIASLQINYFSGKPPYPALSHFGHGILTWTLPYLFRTPLGYNLLVRGPANWPKDGIYPLEGIVETDWSIATFTMNWKLTRPGQQVSFEVDEPICMIVPQRRGELETFYPQMLEIHADPEMADDYLHWNENRSQFLADLKVPGSKANNQAWQKDYFQGKTRDGQLAAEHQTRLWLRKFDPPSGQKV